MLAASHGDRSEGAGGGKNVGCRVAIFAPWVGDWRIISFWLLVDQCPSANSDVASSAFRVVVVGTSHDFFCLDLRLPGAPASVGSVVARQGSNDDEETRDEDVSIVLGDGVFVGWVKQIGECDRPLFLRREAARPCHVVVREKAFALRESVQDAAPSIRARARVPERDLLRTSRSVSFPTVVLWVGP